MKLKTQLTQAAVLGGGGWGTALAQLMTRNKAGVNLWAQEPDVIAAINQTHENIIFLQGVTLSDRIMAIPEVLAAVSGAELVLFAIPTPYLRPFLIQYRDSLPAGVPLVSCAKGIENDSLMTPLEIMLDELPGKYHRYLAVLSGPSFAREVALNMPTNVTVASFTPEVAQQIQAYISHLYFRVYTSPDTVGVEIGGATKNVIAIAAGGSDGFGYGNNARAGLITRGLAEITRLALKKGGNPLTLAGLSGIGDLVLTCTGELSRNRQIGYRLARGETLKEIQNSMKMVAEGIKTTYSIHQLSRKLGVDTPICDMVYQVLYEQKPIMEAIQSLMDRPLGNEIRE